ncbi:hypothetical protein ACFL2J_07825 [Candidatus Omnitrophota bacterium]
MIIPFILILVTILAIVVAVCVFVKKKKDEKSKSETDKIGEETAHEIGIPELVGNLYNDYFRDFSVWIRNEKFCLNSLITDAVELGKQHNSKGISIKTKITLKGNSYIFSFREYNFDSIDGKSQLRGELELFLKDSKVLSLSMARDKDTQGSRWKPIYVEMFIEGPWVEDFQELERVIEQEKNEEKKRV